METLTERGGGWRQHSAREGSVIEEMWHCPVGSSKAICPAGCLKSGEDDPSLLGRLCLASSQAFECLRSTALALHCALPSPTMVFLQQQLCDALYCLLVSAAPEHFCHATVLRSWSCHNWGLPEEGRCHWPGGK